MRRSYGLLLSTCIFLSAIVGWAMETTDFPLGSIDYSGSAVNLAVSRTSPEFTSVSLNSPNIVIQDKVVDFTTYQEIGIPGEPFVFEVGSPTVPQITRICRIPNTGSVELLLTNSEFEIFENINPLPLQLEGSGFEVVRKNESV